MINPITFPFYITTYEKESHHFMVSLVDECLKEGLQCNLEKVVLAIGDGAHDYYYSDITIIGEWAALKKIQTNNLPITIIHHQDI